MKQHRSRVDSLSSNSKMDEQHKLYLNQQFKNNITKFPILKSIHQQVQQLHKIESGKPVESEIWYRGQVDPIKHSETKLLMDKLTNIITQFNPSVQEQLKIYQQQHLKSQMIIETSRIQTVIDAFVQSYKCSLNFIFTLLQEKGARFEQAYDTKLYEPTMSQDFHRKTSVVDLRKDKLINSKFNDFHIENNKLAIEVGYLANKLKEMEQNNDATRLHEQLKALQEESEYEINHLIEEKNMQEKQILKHNQIVVQLRAVILKLEQQIEEQQKYINDNAANFDTMKHTYDQVFYEREYWKNIGQMEQEDLLAQSIRTDNLFKENNKLKNRVKALQLKIDSFKIEKSKVIELPERNKEAEDAFAKLTYMFTTDKYYGIHMRDTIQRKYNKLPEDDQVQMAFLKSIKLDNKYQDPLNKFTYFRQSYMVFFESQLKFIQTEFRQIDHHKISINYFAQIRAILDSKYNENKFVSDVHSITKFPEFVYSWLSTFAIDKITKKVVMIEEKTQAILDNIRLDFLLDVLNPKFANINECITFNEFLFEQGSSDELYYYLHCRYLLFHGTMQMQSRFAFDPIIYVQCDHVDKTIDMIMHKYDPVHLKQVKDTIREQAIQKGKVLLIDGHYALRIMLELYRQERKNRLNMLKEMFSYCLQLQSNGKYGVNYKNFRKLFLFNFPETTELETCTLFRESNMVGDGQVTAESFFAAATECNFFIKQLQLKTILKKPLIENREISYCEYNLPYLEFYAQYKEIPTQLMSDLCISQGLEVQYAELIRLQELIKDLFQDPYNVECFLMSINRYVEICSKLRNIKLYQHHLENAELSSMEIESMKSTAMQLPQIVKPLLELGELEKEDLARKQKKVRVFQKHSKFKLQKFYGLLSALLSTKLNAQVSDTSPRRGRFSQTSIKI